MELTEVYTGGEAWWLLGFEATGPDGLQRCMLEVTALLVFTQARGRARNSGMDDSTSYAKWLSALSEGTSFGCDSGRG